MEESLIENVMEHILHFRPIVRDCYTAISIKYSDLSFTVVTNKKKKHKQRDGKEREKGGGGCQSLEKLEQEGVEKESKGGAWGREGGEEE